MAATTTLDPLRVEEIDQLIALIAAQRKVRVIPGARWAADYLNDAIMYPRRKILLMPPHEARGKIWRTVEHLISSHGELDEYNVAVDAALTIRDTLKVNCVHPRWIVGLFFHAERERATELARKHGRNIETRALPRRGVDYREKELRKALSVVRRKPKTEGEFWQSAGTAIELLLEGTLEAKDLPATLKWNRCITDAIDKLLSVPSYDALLGGIEQLALPIARQRLRDLAGREPAIENDEDENDPIIKLQGGLAGSNDGASEEIEDESDIFFRDPSLLDNIEAEVNSLGSDPVRPDFVDDKPDSTGGENQNGTDNTFNIDEPREKDGDKLPPAWGAVARDAAPLVNVIRQTFLEYLEQNEIGELAYGTRRGRLDVPMAARPSRLQTRPPFKRRSIADDRSYAIGLIIDVSGSMSATTNGPDYPESFGTGPLQRWHVATRMMVATTEALSRLPETDLCIVAYDTPVYLVKAIAQPLDAARKAKLMEHMGAKEGNDDASALQTTITELITSSAEEKIIIHLTDGQFCSNVPDVRKQIGRAMSHGIEVVILTLNIPPSFAHQFVPKDLADEINDDNVGRVLAKHLRRMLRAA